MTFSEVTIATRAGPRLVLVITPKERICPGRARLGELRASKAGEIDREVFEHVSTRRGRLHAVLMCGKNGDGSGEWAIDPALSDADVRELAYLMTKDHAASHRRFMTSGVYIFVHAEFGAREVDAFRGAAERWEAELVLAIRAAPGEASAVQRVDLWALKNLSFWFKLSAERILADTLPQQMLLFESRRPHIEAMVASLPASAR